MRRALQSLALAGIFVAGFSPARAFGEEPAVTAADTAPSASAPAEAQQPAPVAPPVAPAAPVVAIAAAAAHPKLGDVTVSGYLRGGFGGSSQKGRMTCFALANPAGLVSKYRLGNECEIWSETHFAVVAYAGDDGTVATLHFMPTIYIPTTYVGYSPNGTVNSPAIFTTSTGATLSFPNLYVDLKGIRWLAGGTPWIGTRYYKRESVYISDFFYWNPSGVGGGVEDIQLGQGSLRLSVAVFAVDGEPAMPADNTSPLLPAQTDFGIRNDVQLRGIRFWDSGEFQLGFQYIVDASNNSATHGGWGVTLQFVQQLLGGDNKLAIQYGKGGGTGFGTLARFYYPDFSLRHDPIENRFRIVEILTVQPTRWFGAQAAVVYQRDGNFLGSAGQTTAWYSGGARVAFGLTEHFKLLGEVGGDYVTKSNGADPQALTKYTIAPTIAAGRGLLSRPELRLFYTYSRWNEAARGAGVDSGMLYRGTTFLSGSIFGLQAETWW